MNLKPNLFDYATSELSQDAFLAWLIQWADSNFTSVDYSLNACSQNFVRELLGKAPNYEIKSVKVGRQWNNIDVWALINQDYFIVIEDKKGTKEHSNQLKKYAEKAKQQYSNTEIKVKLVYFKMQPQSNYNKIKDSGFSIFNREKMLEILKMYFENLVTNKLNDILIDYYENLRALDKKINGYKTKPLNEWKWFSWQGFYSELQNYINGHWDYVSNRGGGFLGFWWHHKRIKKDNIDIEFYLQLEQDKLTFKLISYNDKERRFNRDFYRKFLFQKANDLNIEISRFGRIGKHMGVAKLKSEYRLINENGLLDFQATVENLKRLMKLLNETEKEITELR